MTTTTLTAIGEAGCSLRVVALIEGYQYALTDAAPAAVVTAYAGTDYVAALGGLEVAWNLDQKLQPWEPFNSSSSSVTLKIQDVSGTNADTFGLAVFKREGMTSSPLFLDTDVLPGSTTVKVKRSDDFAASGNIYIGNEAIGYTTNTTATETFSVLTRGKWSPLKSEGSTRFIRTHRAPATTATNLQPDIESGTSALVADAPIDWRGRWVAVYLHRDMGGVLDVVAQAHLAFAGRISSVVDSDDGCTHVHVDEVRQVIGDAVILREPWRAKVKDGVMLVAGKRFSIADKRAYFSGGVGHIDAPDSNDLVVVAGAPGSVNEITAGLTDGATIEAAINDWLASELAAARLLFRHTFSYQATDTDGNTFSSLYVSDDSVTTQGDRISVLTSTSADVRSFFGWGDDGIAVALEGPYSGTGFSVEPPRRGQVNLGAQATTIQIEDVGGSFVDQSTLMSPIIYANLGATTGVVRIGGVYLACEAPSVSGGSGTIKVGTPINKIIGADDLVDGWETAQANDAGDIEITQVLVLEGTFKELTLALLSSMGGGLNWAAYDLLPAHCSANLPYDLMGTGLEGELGACPGGADVMTVVVDKPTKFADLFGASFTTRLIQFVWRQGRLALRGYATPTSSATLSIGVDTDDNLLTVTTESDALMRNVVKIAHNADATGEKYRDTITITDPGSASNFGSRPVTIKARNAIRGAGLAGEDIMGLLSNFVGGLSFLVRPSMVLRVALDHTMIEQATPGEVVLFTDGFARDPATGTRGLTNKPALVLAQNASWGGWWGQTGRPEPARCEVDLVIFPRLSIAPYSPCAQVDDTATNAGYVVATKVLTCYAHEHSEASVTTKDAERFPVGSKVRVIEIDPATAAAPTTWDDVIAAQSANTMTMTTGLAGWDNTKKYRVYADDYPDALTAQRAFAFQADDADGQIADLRAPFAMSYSPTGQTSTFTLAAATELPERTPTAAYGDGVALDTGHARAVARGVNNLTSYKTAPQNPNALGSAEVMTYGGSGTYTLVWYEPVYIGIGTTTGALTRKLYVSPTIKKLGGASGNIRVTLARRLPRSVDPSAPSRVDVVRLEPYVSTTFNTTSATFENQAAVALDISHLQLAPNHAGGGGVGWLYVEVGQFGYFRGMGVKYLGPVVHP